MSTKEEVDLWRIRYVLGDVNTSWPEAKLYQSEKEMQNALFRFLLETNSHHSNSGKGIPKYLWFKEWLRSLQKEQEQQARHQCKQVKSVEHLEDNQWVPYAFDLIPPKLQLQRVNHG